MNPPVITSAFERFMRRHATALKLFLVGLLTLVLLIPLAMVNSTLRERRERHEAAVAEITHVWGKSQRLFGPVLVVPYTFRGETDEWTTVVGADGRRTRERVPRTVSAEMYLLPERLEIEGELDVSERRRGIYTAHVYTAQLQVRGRFDVSEARLAGIPHTEIHWGRARVGIALTDLRGTRETLVLRWNGTDVPLQTGARLDGLGPGVHAPVTLAASAASGRSVEFSLGLTLNGSGALTVVPVGQQTRLKLASAWRDPGFVGGFLPVERTVSAAGFEASWQVGHYGRDFPQAWSTAAGGQAPESGALEAGAFGVSLVETVSAYRTVERAIKYGVLFLALVFATFFLFEALSAVSLGALNYLLVGAALCLFYLGLLALSEFIAFAAAYATSAAASLLLIGTYCRSVLRSGRRAAVVAAMLAGVYGYLFFVLRMEDFALLAGTVALFALLAAVMWTTRRLDLHAPEPATAGL